MKKMLLCLSFGLLFPLLSWANPEITGCSASTCRVLIAVSNQNLDLNVYVDGKLTLSTEILVLGQLQKDTKFECHPSERIFGENGHIRIAEGYEGDIPYAVFINPKTWIYGWIDQQRHRRYGIGVSIESAKLINGLVREYGPDQVWFSKQ